MIMFQTEDLCGRITNINSSEAYKKIVRYCINHSHDYKRIKIKVYYC